MNVIEKTQLVKLLKSNKLRIVLAYVFALLLLITSYNLFITKTLDTIEYKIYDIKVAFLNKYAQEADPEIALLLYDNRSVNFVNDHPDEGLTRWPLPRSTWGYINNFLERGNAQAIIYDITFYGKSDDYNDDIFASSLKKTSNVYMPATPNSFLAPLFKKISAKIKSKSNMNSDIYIDKMLNSPDLSAAFRSSILENSVKKALFRSLDIDYKQIDQQIIIDNSFFNINLPYYKFLDNLEGIGLIHVSTQGAENVIRGNVLFGKFPFNNYLYSISFIPVLNILNIKADSIKLIGEKFSFADKVIPLDENGNFLINWRKYKTRRSFNFISIYLYEKYYTIDPVTGYKVLPSETNYFSPPDEMILLKGLSYLTSEGNINPRKGIRKLERYHDTVLFPGAVSNKILFIGNGTATGDIHKTPLGFTTGSHILANMTDNFLNDDQFVHQASWWMNMLFLAVMMSVILGLVKVSKSNITLLLCFLALLTMYTIINITLYKVYLLWLPLVKPVFFSTIFFILSLVTQNLLTKEDLKNTYKLATTDGLTGLFNHRYFQEKMAHKLQDVKRREDKFSLLLIDIDFFKKFNDTYGHRAGDAVLIQVGQALNQTVRTYDIVCRYGGEEMCVILDKTETLEAIDIGNKLVKTIATTPFDIEEDEKPKQVNVTISVGVANYPEHGKEVQELIEFADQGLYRAKEGGRNQVGPLEDVLEGGSAEEKQGQIKELEIAKSKFKKISGQIKNICKTYDLNFNEVIEEVIKEIESED